MSNADRHDEVNDCFPSPFVGLSMTLDEFHRSGLHFLKPYLELIDGIVCQRDAFRLQESAVLGHLLGALEGVDGKRRHGLALPSLGCIVGELFLVPAGSYFRKSTLQARGITSFRQDPGLPDIVIEMATIETCGYTMPEKCLRYLEIGIPVVILVDADDESVQIMRPNQPAVTVRGDQCIDLSDIVPDLDLTASTLFRAAIPDWFWARSGQAEDEAAAPERSEG